MYDKEFKIAPYLVDGLVQMVNQDLINYHKLPVESEDNNRDEQT
jgi:hypothetical protein